MSGSATNVIQAPKLEPRIMRHELGATGTHVGCEHGVCGAWGALSVGLFAVTWAAALAIWRFGRIEQRWERAAARQRPR